MEKKRSEVDNNYKWDLTKYYKSDEKWQEEFKRLKEHVNDLNIYKGKIFDNDNLYQLFETYYSYLPDLDKLYIYASLKHDEDLSISKYSKMFNEASSLYNLFGKNTSFITPEILHSEKFDIKKLIKKHPKLERFKHILEEMKIQKEYIKDEKTEEIISLLTRNDSYYDNLASTLLNSNIDYGIIKDKDGNEVNLNTGNYGKFLNSNNRDERKTAYYQMNKNRTKFANILGDNLLTYMNNHSAMAKVRGFNSTKEMDFKIDNIPIKVHNSLLKNMEKGINLFQKYYDIRRKVFNLDKLKPYDLTCPIISSSKNYTIETAKEYVYNSVKVLGDDYANTIKKGFDEKWIDFLPYKSKQSGGYCTAVYKVTPNILMSFNGNFTDISTIAHEMGHGVNFVNIFENNNYEYAYTSHYVSEIPSLLNEILLANYILNNDFSREEKLLALDHILLTINNNFFDAILENQLEEIVYQKMDNLEILDYEDLNTIIETANKKYYGDTLDLGEYVKYRWITRSHYFEPWYLYKYATCICGAVYFASRILKGDKNTLDLYKQFLKTGADSFPNDILLKYNIDLTDSKIYDEFFEYYSNLLDEFERLNK